MDRQQKERVLGRLVLKEGAAAAEARLWRDALAGRSPPPLWLPLKPMLCDRPPV